MKSYSLTDVRTALASCGVKSADTVFVHSNLFSLGKLEGVSPADGPRCLVDTFLHHLGNTGTLGVPTFNFDFCQGHPYDRQRTPSQMMGAFNEQVRLHGASHRSRHPLQSTAFIGRLASDYTEADTVSGYGPNSPFDKLLKNNAKLLLLGCGFTAASFIHYVEEQAQVPYRYWKEFSGAYTDAGITRQVSYRMYVRNLDLDPSFELAKIERWLGAQDLMIKSPLGGEFVRVCNFADYYRIVSQEIQRDPFVLVKKMEVSASK